MLSNTFEVCLSSFNLGGNIDTFQLKGLYGKTRLWPLWPVSLSKRKFCYDTNFMKIVYCTALSALTLNSYHIKWYPWLRKALLSYRYSLGNDAKDGRKRSEMAAVGPKLCVLYEWSRINLHKDTKTSHSNTWTTLTVCRQACFSNLKGKSFSL